MRLRAASLMGGAFGLLLSFLVPAPANAAAGPRFQALRMTVDPEYARTHTVYATGTVPGCRSDCVRLARTHDGGATWQIVKPAGWNGGEVTGARRRDGRSVLFTTTSNRLAVSADGGAHFTQTSAPGGQVDAAALPDGDAAALVSVDGSAYLYRDATRRAQRVSGSTLRQATLFFMPDGTGALAGGTEASTTFPYAERCDAAFRCSGRVLIAAKQDHPRLYVSPSFNADGFVIATLTRGGIYRSRDGARSFEEITVVTPPPDALISAVQAIAFSPDFDAARARGTVYAGVLTVRGTSGGPGQLSGGVYASRDAGRTWTKLGGAGPPDGGVSALAAPPDGRVIAAYLGTAPGQGLTGGFVCTTDGTRWNDACPAYTAAGTAAQTTPAPSGTQSSSRGSPIGTAQPANDLASRDTSTDRESRSAVPVLLAIMGVAAAGLMWRFARRRAHVKRPG